MKRLFIALAAIMLVFAGWMVATGQRPADMMQHLTGASDAARLEQLRNAAQDGEEGAGFLYAGHLLTSEQPDVDAGIGYLDQTARQGDNRARLALALMHIAGRNVAQDDEAAGRLFLDMAEDGNIPAQAIVGDMFERGWAVPASADMATRFYRQAARGGSVQARHRLWEMLQRDEIPSPREAEIAALSRDAFTTDILATLFEIVTTRRALSPDPEGGAVEAEQEAMLPAGRMLDALMEPAIEAGFVPALIDDARRQVLFSDAERLAWQMILEKHDPRAEKGLSETLAVDMSPEQVAVAEALAARTSAKIEAMN